MISYSNLIIFRHTIQNSKIRINPRRQNRWWNITTGSKSKITIRRKRIEPINLIKKTTLKMTSITIVFRKIIKRLSINTSIM